MTYWAVSSVLLVLCGSSSGDLSSRQRQIQQQLFNATRYPQYNTDVLPISDSVGLPVVVEVDTLIISIGPINEMDMTWTLSCYLRQEWTDPRLILNVSDMDNMARLENDHISWVWTPDIYFSNSKVDSKHLVTTSNHLFYINVSNGHILYSQRLTMVLDCQMELEKFPHDKQSCDVKLESYSYKTDYMILKWSTKRQPAELLPSISIPEYSIIGTSVKECNTTYAIGTFPCLKIIVQLNREIGYYITESYIPTILIAVLSWASFWIDHEAVPARISVGLLTVLTITTQLSGSRAQLPKVPYIKAIDVWMSTNLVFVFAAYMEYAVVIVLSRRYKKILAGQKAGSGTVVKPLAREQNPIILTDLADNNLALNGHEHDNNQNPLQDKNGNAVQGMLAPGDYTGSRSASSSPGSTRKLPSSIFHGYDSKDTGRVVDKFSRLFFPFCFVIFNAIYWIYYVKLA